jgi:molybdenum cofactor guanylyltransferase
MDCLILAGGQGKRLVPEKGLLSFGGSTVLDYIIKERAPFFPRVSLVVSDEEPYRRFGVPLIRDRFPGTGPLGALLSGLMACEKEAFFCACDMPFIRKELVTCILAGYVGVDVVVPVFRDFLEPLCAVYSRSCIDPIFRLLTRSSYKLTGFYPSVRVRRLEQEVRMIDEKGLSFFNINSPADYHRALNLLEREVPSHGFLSPGSCHDTGVRRATSLSAC